MRPSPRGGRSSARAATKTTRPRRFWAADSAGPVRSSSSARRTCACGQAEQVGLDRRRAAVARQQQRAAGWRGEVHGQRRGGAHRGVERLLRRRRARVEDDQRARVGLGDQLALHQPGAAGERRPVDARGGRALAVLAQAVDLGLGGGDQRRAGVRGDAVAAARGRADREHARQHEHLVGVRRPVTTRWARPNGSRSTSAGGASTRRPRRANVTSTRTRARRRPGGQPHGLGQQRLVDPAGRQRQAPALAPRSRTAAAPPRRRCARRAVRRIARAPRRRAPIQAAAPAPSSTQRRAGDVERLGVERARRRAAAGPRALRSRAAERIARPPRAPGSGDGVGHDLARARRRPPRARA